MMSSSSSAKKSATAGQGGWKRGNTKTMTIVLSLSFLLAIQWAPLAVNAACPNHCSKHGICTNEQECICNYPHMGADCSLKECPKSNAWQDLAVDTDVAHQPSECSNRGYCNRQTGNCECDSGYTGTACERNLCPNDCSGNGICVSISRFAEERDPGDEKSYSYTEIWDAHKLYMCVCDDRYTGIDCSQEHCPWGDDPLTGTQEINPQNILQYNAQQRFTCIADGGTFTIAYKKQTSKPINFDAKHNELDAGFRSIRGLGEVKIVMNGPQACTAQGSSFTAEFLQDFGNQPLFVTNDAQLVNSGAVAKKLIVDHFVIGTKENLYCSGRGICNHGDGKCECSYGYSTSNGYNAPGTRGDCGHHKDKIQECPGTIQCSGHGVCSNDPQYKCTCDTKYTGADCSDKLCPTGHAWWSYPDKDEVAHVFTHLECSGVGDCDRSTGHCKCHQLFTGDNCERLKCPGEIQSDSGETLSCSGHGQCLSMERLAELSKENGVLKKITYGNTPNDRITWDADLVQGCYCDEMWEGHDCALRSCIHGDNPDTHGQLDEEQRITCVADGNNPAEASVVLIFREEQTTPLAATATMADVKAALEALKTIDVIAVDKDPTDADSLCGYTNNAPGRFLVRFKSQHGDVPPLEFVANKYITLFTVEEVVRGNKESLVCSDRGLCNHATGDCECFPGYGSSNYQGQSGLIPNCGHVIEFAGASINQF